jgi:NAD+ kinase
MAKVLLVTKTSAWDWHGAWYQAQYQKGVLPEWDYARIKQAHDEHQETVRQATSILDAAGLDFRQVNVDSKDWAPDADTSYVLTLGGDGTLLSASHRVESDRITLIGVRSAGSSVGYLCAGGADRLSDLVAQVKSNAVVVKEASRLRAEIHPNNGSAPRVSAPALNDFLYSNANPAATTRYRLSLGERVEEHKSSGLWVSTALGSTAGIYAAGGVIMPRTDTNFQYAVRELYRAPGKNFYLVNGFFDPDRKPLVIENRCEQAVVAADGNHGVLNIEWGDRVVFQRAPSIKIAQG